MDLLVCLFFLYAYYAHTAFFGDPHNKRVYRAHFKTTDVDESADQVHIK